MVKPFPLVPSVSLPKTPQKPHNPRDERKGRTLTIAAGFRCKNGVVLCADRLITHGGPDEPGSFASYETKVFAVENFFSFSAIACGAGDASLIRPIAESFLSALRNCQQPPELRMSLAKSILEDTLNDFAAKIASIPDVQLLIAANDDKGNQQFLRCQGLVVHPANDTEVLGIGENSLVRYLIDSVYREDMDLNELVSLAVLIVQVAKKYCPQYCGGDTDVYALSKSYEFLDATPIVRAEINRLEKRLLEELPKQIRTTIEKITYS